MTGNAIEAIGLSKKFRMQSERRTSFKERVVRGHAPEKQEFWALRDATFHVPKGSSLGIIGHNGSGKSTALKVLTGIYRPTAGSVRVDGTVSALLEVGAGFHPELTGRENIRLNATILGFTGKQINSMMGEIIEFADIGDHLDAPIKHYSSGMYVRLGFSIAVMVKPEILIVDEVIAVGDEEFQRRCYEYLHGLRRAGTSMVIVSHGLAQITELCDAAVWLDHGEVRQIGPSRSVVRGYLDSVNTKEAERAASESGEGPEVEAERQLPRRGSGQLRITDVQFLDHSGAPSELLIAERTGTIRLHYTAQADCEDVVFTVGIDDANEAVVTGMDNRRLAPWSLVAGSGTVDFVADPVLLAGGVYRLRVQVYVNGQLADAIDSDVHLTVRPPDTEQSGVFLQPGHWSMSHDRVVT